MPPGMSVQLVSATAWQSAWRDGGTKRIFQSIYPAFSSTRSKNKLSHQDCLPSQSEIRPLAVCFIALCLNTFLCTQSACSLVLLPFFDEILMPVTSTQVLKTMLRFTYGISVELEVQLLIDLKKIYGSF